MSRHPEVERAHVFLRGVPVGALWLSDGDVVITSLEPGEGFAAISDEVQQYSKALWKKGFLHETFGGPRIAIEALAPSSVMAFELRDLNGNALHADFVNVVASPRKAELPVVVVCRKYAHAAVASMLRMSPRAAGDDRQVNF